jgi:hypothetical protein
LIALIVVEQVLAQRSRFVFAAEPVAALQFRHRRMSRSPGPPHFNRFAAADAGTASKLLIKRAGGLGAFG